MLFASHDDERVGDLGFGLIVRMESPEDGSELLGAERRAQSAAGVPDNLSGLLNREYVIGVPGLLALAPFFLDCLGDPRVKLADEVLGHAFKRLLLSLCERSVGETPASAMPSRRPRSYAVAIMTGCPLMPSSVMSSGTVNGSPFSSFARIAGRASSRLGVRVPPLMVLGSAICLCFGVCRVVSRGA